MEDLDKIIDWLIKEENYDMSRNIDEVATDLMKDHTMLDVINLISDYNKFVLFNVRQRSIPFYCFEEEDLEEKVIRCKKQCDMCKNKKQ